MIATFDRSYYFGASDTSQIMRSWETKTFDDWWLVKAGITENESFENIYTQAGCSFEHAILDSLAINNMKYGEVAHWGECERLKVNLDGSTETTIYEVKSVMLEKAMDYPRKLPLNYWRQVQVQMLATGLRDAHIVAYGLQDDDYQNEIPTVDDIDLGRRFIVPVEYDETFISEYTQRLLYLANCLEHGTYPMLREVADDV